MSPLYIGLHDMCFKLISFFRLIFVMVITTFNVASLSRLRAPVQYQLTLVAVSSYDDDDDDDDDAQICKARPK